MTHTSTPPPRPSQISDRPALVNEDRTPRTLTIRLRWDAVLTATAALVIGFAGGLAVAGPIVAQVNEHQAGVPWCTAPIADAGGVCHGEPLEACAAEDSADCYWDARGSGRSFVDVGGVVYYQDVNP